MSAELVSILVLVVVFVIATTRSINMGALAFAAAFGVGTLAAGMDADGIFAGFPGDLFVVLVGVTYLFSIARANGTTDWLVHASIRLVGGRLVLIPWVMFAISGTLTAIGAVSPAAVAIVAPIALNFASQYRISPLLMGAMVVHGAQAGGFSPISIYGTIVNGIVAREGLPSTELVLFLASIAMNLVIAVLVFVVCGGLKLARTAQRMDRPAMATAAAAPGGGSATAGGSGGSGPDSGFEDSGSDGSDSDGGGSASLRLTPARIATLAGLAALVTGALVFDLDVGLSAITLAVLLSIVWPDTSRQAINHITWPTVLLICGMLTYVGVLQEMGTIDYAGEAVSDVGIPLLAALLLCYIGAIVSAFASSVGIMGALIPLAVPFLAEGTIGPIGMVCALAVASTVVDVSPFSTNGALVLANVDDDVDSGRFFRQLMIYGGLVVAVAPAVAWLILVVPGFG
ncbi:MULTISPECIES: SLC13 family permease [Prauserella salsuginis group]|uniref:SLC13 family permease n=1 Tax=Prauserella salsuginis TaxID=387889 RepID=A0ABW6G2L2_9PSEU|nr:MULTISPECIES: SLC13 family permease [Prauserella salsuginis group]MCR3719782.1 transporter, UIT1 family (TC 9.B.48) [Prauserella flava]MCR3736675.1 transporter, UIT1 family (TC 9.B.48) [Prauserella salsuginis]